MPLPEELTTQLRERGLTVATAESLTGGDVCSALVDVPGASAVVRGGVVAYTAQMKTRLLGVDADLIDRHGVVSEPVALAMARGVREATGASLGLATTGVAGPEPHGGQPPGRVCVAAVGSESAIAWTLDLEGDRHAIRAATVAAVLAAGLQAINVTAP